MRSRLQPRSLRWLAPLAAAAIGVLAGSTTALAGGLTAGKLVRVPDNPLATSTATCSNLVAEQTALGSKNFADAEVEPYVAVDPTNPMHLVGSVQQDRWSDGGSNGLTNVVSTDGGATWKLATKQPAFSICAGAAPGSAGFFNRATDPWVSFSADGKTAYSISDSFNANGPGFGGASSIIVSRSTDGGMTWQAPVTARLDASVTVLNDKESVTADPLIASSAYAVWDRLVSPTTTANPSATLHANAFRGPAMFSRTTDSGKTWSQGRMIFDPGQNDQTIGNQIVVPTAGPAKGQLIDGMNLITNQGGKCPFTGSECDKGAIFSAAIIRSTDGGNTFSDPTFVGTIHDAPVRTLDGRRVRTGDILPAWAAGPTGNLYAVWQDGGFSPTGHAKIAFSQSTDGGSTWSTPIRVDQSPGDVQAFTPQIAVRADGTVAVTYYDFENATTAAPGLTDQFIVSCSSACSKAASWAAGGETRLSTTGSFDMKTAPVARGFFVGDYEGLVASGKTFRSLFVMAKPIATAGPTDLFANTAS